MPKRKVASGVRKEASAKLLLLCGSFFSSVAMRAASAKRLLLCSNERGDLGSEKGGLGEATSLMWQFILCGSEEGGFGEAASLVWQ